MRDFTKKYFHLNSSAVYNSSANKCCVMNTTAGYVIMYTQNDVMMVKNVI